MSDAFERAARGVAPAVEGRNATDDAIGKIGLALQFNGGLNAGGAGFAAAGAGSAASAVGFGIGLGSPIFSLFAGLYAVGRAGERGEALGRYNAFLVAFARTVSDFSRGIDRRRRNAAYQDASVRGRNAAIKVLTRLGSDGRSPVFARYRRMPDQRAVDIIVALMGGLRTR